MEPVSIPLYFSPGFANQSVAGGAGRIVFISTREVSGTASALWLLYDGSIATNIRLISYSLAPSESARDEFTEHGIPFRGDLTVQTPSGQHDTIVHIVPEHRWADWRAEYWLGFDYGAWQAGVAGQ